LISDYIIGNLVQIYCSINVVGQGINEQILSNNILIMKLSRLAENCTKSSINIYICPAEFMPLWRWICWSFGIWF